MSAVEALGFEVSWLGRVGYAEALAIQRAAREAVIAGEGPERLLLLEHPATVTLGRRGGEIDRASLERDGVPVVWSERGGLATVHAPGQLVVYLIADLARRRWRVPDVVAALEDGVILWLASRGVAAGRRAGAPGVWVDDAKIAAIGLHLAHQVSMHGLALNLSPDLGLFDRIVPCGLVGLRATSLHRVTGAAPAVEDAAPAVGASVLRALGALSGEVASDRRGAV